ncbi:armadillo repeat-containing protein 10 [Megalops cyprinoides]|uniref:armadillo repeat-containing protein 10 n=1 Tax=Megalops cyprinoides TaxID=118141 RepID=UPI001864F5C3|nr:armadillo repeat-containing protein 10 [Megalops cyprinoides]
MGDDDSVIPKLCNMKALLGIVVGAGASYGIYKLVVSGKSRDNRAKKPKNDHAVSEDDPEAKASSGSGAVLQPGTLLAKVSGLTLVHPSENQAADVPSGEVLSKSPGSLEPQHLQMLVSLLHTSPSDRVQVLVTLGNAAAFSINQELIREFGGLHIIASLLSDPSPDVRVQCLNALNNLSMNVRNQEQLKVYVPQVLELIEMSPVNSDLQLASLRLLTNLSVTNDHQHLMKNSITLFLSLLVVSNETLQTQVLKVLVNLSANPDMIEDIVQAQAPASLVLLFDGCTTPPVLLRLLTFVGNLRSWTPSAHVAEALQRSKDSLYCVLLGPSSQLRHRLPLLLTHPDAQVSAQVARLLT